VLEEIWSSSMRVDINLDLPKEKREPPIIPKLKKKPREELSEFEQLIFLKVLRNPN
jgi:hypothetical protein